MDNQTIIDPDEAVSAFFESLEAAERAESKLKKAGFAPEVIYLVPRAPRVTVTVDAPDRLDEARKILEASGGELREADVNASGSVMFRLSPDEVVRSERPEAGDDEDVPDVEHRLPKRSTDVDGAGSATGGALF